MDTTSLGNRQKRYEQASQTYFTRRVPVIVRCDGNCFSSWTKGLERPFDENFRKCMEYATFMLCKEMSGARLGYTQSDEITVVLVDYQTYETEPWFDYKKDKVISMAATICSSAFNWACLKYLPEHVKKKGFARFDARAFNIPVDDVVNNFIWRQRDCEKNSIQSLARSHFSQKQLFKKNTSDMQDMLMLEKGVNWNNVETKYKRGMAVYKMSQKKIVVNRKTSEEEEVLRSRWFLDYQMPIISKDQDFVNKKIYPELSCNFLGSDTANVGEVLYAKDVFEI